MTKELNDIDRNLQITSQIQYFKELFLKYYNPLCAYALRFVGDVDISKDIVQDSFVALWEKRSDLDYAQSLRPLIYNIVHNKVIDHFRRSSTGNTSLDDIGHIHPLDVEWDSIVVGNIIEEIDCKLISDEVDKCLEFLPSHCAEIYCLSRKQGLSNKEIAATLGISTKAVEKQMTRALSAIRAHLLNTGYLSAIFYTLFFLPRI